jgi:hypothetical protein
MKYHQKSCTAIGIVVDEASEKKLEKSRRESLRTEGLSYRN